MKFFGEFESFLSARQPSRRNNIRGTDGLRRCDNALMPAEWIHLAVIRQRLASNKSPILHVDGDVVAKTEVTTPVDSIDAEAASNKYVGNDASLSEPMTGDLDDLRLDQRTLNETEIGALTTLAAIQPE